MNAILKGISFGLAPFYALDNIKEAENIKPKGYKKIKLSSKSKKELYNYYVENAYSADYDNIKKDFLKAMEQIRKEIDSQGNW